MTEAELIQQYLQAMSEAIQRLRDDLRLITGADKPLSAPRISTAEEIRRIAAAKAKQSPLERRVDWDTRLAL